MSQALLWGLASGAALLLGSFVALAVDIPRRALGLVMGFGAGVLISALAFELTQEAHSSGGLDAVALGLATGALAFYFGDRWIDSSGGEHRKRSGHQQAMGSGTAIALGTVLDGVPESVVIGIGLLEGQGVGIAFAAAVFLSNLPEAMSASTGMRRAGRSPRSILALWTAVALMTALASLLGYVVLGEAGGNVIAIIQAFAAGAILVMLADTMMPEAFDDAHQLVGLVTVLGFVAGFFLSTLE